MICPQKAAKKEPEKLKQLPVVLKTVAAVMIVSAAVEIGFGVIGAVAGMPVDVNSITPYLVDIFLAWCLLKGKVWARTWILIRCFLGLLYFGGMSIISSDISAFIIQAIYVLVVTWLLFGVGSKKKAAVLGALYGISLIAYAGIALLGFRFIAEHKQDKFVSERHGIEIRRPSNNWLIIPEGEFNSMVFKIPGEIVELSHLNENLVVAVLTSDIQGQDVEAAGKALSLSIAQDARNTITNESKTRFQDMDAYEIRYSTKAGMLSAESRFIITVSNNNFYGILIGGSKDAVSRRSEDIEKILSSLRIR